MKIICFIFFLDLVMCFICLLGRMQNNNVLVFNVLFFNALQALCFDDGMFSGFVAVFFKLFGNGECFYFSRTFDCLL